MLNIKDLSILPQGGHGYIPVISAAIAENPSILATLDEEGNLVLWDIPSGKQFADISLVAWDDQLFSLDDLDVQYTSRQVHPDQIRPNQLLIKDDRLYAYGRNGVFFFDLSTIYDGLVSPQEIHFFGKAQEDLVKLDQFMLETGKEMAYPTGKVTFDCYCEKGTLSAGRTFYLYEYQSSLYRSEIGKQEEELLKFSQTELGVPINKAKAFAYNEETQKLAIVFVSEQDENSGEAIFYSLDVDESLKREKSFSIRFPFWLSPEADHVLWLEDDDERDRKWDWQLCKNGFAIKEKLRTPIPIDGDILQIDYVSEIDYCVVNSFRRLRVYQLSPLKEIYRLDQPGFGRGGQAPSGSIIKNKYKPLALSSNGRLMASVPGWLNKDNTQIRSSNGALMLGNLERRALDKKLNIPRPKIKNLELFEQAETGLEFINVFLDNGSICTMQLGGVFKLRKKYEPMDYAIRYLDAASNPVDDVVALIKDKTLQLIRGDELTQHVIGEHFIPQKVVFAPDGLHMAMANQDGNVLILDAGTLEINRQWAIGDQPLQGEGDCIVHQLVFHPQQEWLAVVLNLSPVLVEVVVFDWEGKELMRQPLGLSEAGEYCLSFGETGKYLIFRGIGNTRIWKTSSDFEEILDDPAQNALIKKYRGEGKNKKADQEAVFAQSVINKKYTITSSSPVLLKEDTHLLLERKDEGSIEIWNLEELEKGFGNASIEPVFSIDTRNIPYSSFRILKKKPVILFFRERDEWIKLVNWETGQLLATILPFDDRHFLILDESNHYYTSPEGYDLAVFKMGKRLFPMEQFDLMFNRPDKVLANIGLSTEDQVGTFERAFEKRTEKILEDRLEQLFDFVPENILRSIQLGMLKGFRERMLKEEFSMPEIRIIDKEALEKSKPAAEFSFQAIAKTSSPEERLTQLNVYVNDVPIYGKGGVPLQWGRIASYMEKTRLSVSRCGNQLEIVLEEEDGSLTFDFTINLRLSKGQNKIQVSVLNMDGIEAFDTFYINRRSRYKPKLHFIGIAIGPHEHHPKPKNLEFPEKDLAKLVNELKALQTANKVGFDQLLVHTLPSLENENNERNTTKEQIIEFLKKQKAKLKNAQVDDRVILFYSGHGLRNEMGDWSLVLSCKDMDLRDISTGIKYEDFENFLDGIGPRNKLLIIDACESGELDLEGLQETDILDPAGRTKVTELFNLVKNTFFDLRRGTGSTIIAASQGDQDALDGVLVTNLISGLKKGKKRISELTHYLIKEVPARLVMEALDKGALKEKPQGLKKKLEKTILNLLSLELPQAQLKERLIKELMEEFAEKLPAGLDIKGEIVEPLLNNLQQPSLRAENISNDWQIF